MGKIYIKDLVGSNYLIELGFDPKQSIDDVNKFKNNKIKYIVEEIENPFKYYIFKYIASEYGFESYYFKKALSNKLNRTNTYTKIKQLLRVINIFSDFDNMTVIYKNNLHYKTKRKIIKVTTNIYTLKRIFDSLTLDFSYNTFREVVNSESELRSIDIERIDVIYSLLKKEDVNDSVKLIDLLRL